MKREDWNRRYAEADLVWSAEPDRFVAEELSELAPGRAIDLASGEGRNAVWLAERGWRVEAVDFAESGLDKGRRLAAARNVEVTWVLADLLEHGLEPHGYDLVLICFLQLPWTQMRDVLRRAAAAVAPGGTLLLVGHDRSNLERGHGGPKSAEVLYTAEQVAAELVGLTPVEVATRERAVETESGTAVALDCLVRATA